MDSNSMFFTEEALGIFDFEEQVLPSISIGVQVLSTSLGASEKATPCLA